MKEFLFTDEKMKLAQLRYMRILNDTVLLTTGKQLKNVSFNVYKITLFCTKLQNKCTVPPLQMSVEKL